MLNVSNLKIIFIFKAVRMGFMGAKAAVVKMLSKYDLKTVSNKPIEFDNFSIGLIAKGGLSLKVSKRQTTCKTLAS